MNHTKTRFNLPFYLTLLIVLTAFTTGCTEKDALNTLPSEVVERIDIVLEKNDSKEYIYLQSEQANTQTDLVDYNFYNSSSNKMDFELEIDDRRKLIFTVSNSNQPNFWELENSSYSLHTDENFNDVYKYVTAKMISGGETTYVSNVDNAFPNEVQLDVFTIKEYDSESHEILIHIEDFPIAQSTTDNLNTLIVNGTFRGSLTFIN